MDSGPLSDEKQPTEERNSPSVTGTRNFVTASWSSKKIPWSSLHGELNAYHSKHTKNTFWINSFNCEVQIPISEKTW